MLEPEALVAEAAAAAREYEAAHGVSPSVPPPPPPAEGAEGDAAAAAAAAAAPPVASEKAVLGARVAAALQSGGDIEDETLVSGPLRRHDMACFRP